VCLPGIFFLPFTLREFNFGFAARDVLFVFIWLSSAGHDTNLL